MTAESNRKTVDFDEACRFVIRFGRKVHGYGPNARRLEAYLARLTKALGYEGTFRSTPTELYLAFTEHDGEFQHTHLEDLPGTGIDLARLAATGELVKGIESGELSVAEATRKLADVDKLKPPFGNLALAANYAGIGVGFAMLLGGGWPDVIFAALLSLVVFGMVTLAGKMGGVAVDWLPLSTAFVSAVLAGVIRIFVPELNFLLTTLCAILVLIPGYSVSVGIIELMLGRTLSGASNLLSGIVYLTKQFAGAWLGYELVMAVLPSTAAKGTPVSPEWIWCAIPLLIVGLVVVFQTPWRDCLWAGAGCGVAWGGIVLGSHLSGANLGNLFGTILAVAYANLWSRFTDRPTSIALLPAIVLLVSGSIGFRGLAALATGNTVTGEQQVLQMFVVAATMAAGLLVGNTIVRPKVTL